MQKQKPMPNVVFDKRNLRSGEEVLFTFKPDKKSYMIRNFFFGGGIPFPVALLWAVIDFGVMIGVPIGTKQYNILFILIPFMAVHGAPIWIYIWGVVNGAKDYQNCGHMITNYRIITRAKRNEAFDEFAISEISSLTILSTKSRNSSLHIAMNHTKKPHTLHALRRQDVDRAIDIYYDLKEREKHKDINDRYKAQCSRCGGRTDSGYCMYCGSRAQLKKEYTGKK